MTCRSSHPYYSIWKKYSVVYYFHRFRGSEPEHWGWLGLEEYQHPKEDAALFLALSLSSSEAATTLLFSRFFRGQGTRTRGKRAMFSSSSHFSCTRNLEGCCFHLKARVRTGLKWSLQRPPTCTTTTIITTTYATSSFHHSMYLLSLVRLLLDLDFCTHCTLLPNNSHLKILASKLLVIMLGHANLSQQWLLVDLWDIGWNGRGEYVNGWENLSYIFIHIFVPKLYHCAR